MYAKKPLTGGKECSCMKTPCKCCRLLR